MGLHSIHAPFHNSISGPEPFIRKRGMEDVLNIMRDSVPLIKNRERDLFIIIHPGHHISRTPAHTQFQNCLESLKLILESPLSSGFHICIENMLSSHFGGKSSELLGLISNFEEHRISICLDTCHSVYDSTPLNFLDEVFPHVTTVHISDNYHQSQGEFHAVPMTLKHSRIRWRQFFRKLSSKLDTIIIEINKPPEIDVDLYLEMARISTVQIERFIL